MQPFQPTYISAVQQIKAYRVLRAGVQAILDPYGINATQWAILGSLLVQPAGLTLVALARILDVKPPLVTTIVAPLEEKKWVEQLEGEADRRVKKIRITKAGRALTDKIEADLVADGARMFQGVTEAEMKAYHQVLEAIINSQN
jgi:MarR family transcriptional regulator for hemolysin